MISASERPDLSKSVYLSTLAALLGLGVIVHAWHLGDRSIWFDEGVSIGIAHLPLRDGVRAAANEVNTFLYYFVVRLLCVFSDSVTYLRLSSVLFGTASIAVFSTFVGRVFDRRVALTTAVLLSVNVLRIHYMREIRGYPLLLLLIAISWLACERCFRTGKGRWYVLWGACSAAAIYVHLFSVFALAAQLCWLPFWPEWRLRLRQVARMIFWVGVSWIPMARMISDSDRQQIVWVPPVSRNMAQIFLYDYFGFSKWTPWVYLPLFGAACVLFAASFMRADGQSQRKPLAVPVLGTLVPFALLILLSVTLQPALLARYALYTTFTLALAAAVVLCRLPRILGVAGFLLIAVLAMPGIRDVDRHDPVDQTWQDFRSATQFIGTHAQAGDVLFVWRPQSRYAIEYYQRHMKFTPFPAFVYPGTDGDSSMAQFAAKPDLPLVDGIANSHSRIWLFLDLNVPREKYSVFPLFFLRRFGVQHRIASETKFRNATVYELEPLK